MKRIHPDERCSIDRSPSSPISSGGPCQGRRPAGRPGGALPRTPGPIVACPVATVRSAATDLWERPTESTIGGGPVVSSSAPGRRHNVFVVAPSDWTCDPSPYPASRRVDARSRGTGAPGLHPPQDRGLRGPRSASVSSRRRTTCRNERSSSAPGTGFELPSLYRESGWNFVS